jgi:hypothetical protein
MNGETPAIAKLRTEFETFANYLRFNTTIWTSDEGPYYADHATDAAWRAWQAKDAEPIKMVLFCPACGTQHIDRDQPEWMETYYSGAELVCIKHPAWSNKPHKSHLCLKLDDGCGHVWRPADVPTEGVTEIATKGKDDSVPVRQWLRRSMVLETLPVSPFILHSDVDGVSITATARPDGTVLIRAHKYPEQQGHPNQLEIKL